MTRASRAVCERASIVFLVLSLVAPPARAQSTAIVFTGRVIDVEGRPLASASVSIGALDGVENHVEMTKADGTYRVVMSRRASVFLVVVRKEGFAVQMRQVAGAVADSVITVAEFRMERSAQALPAVQVVANRPRPVRDQERIFEKPGENAVTLDASSEFASTLTGDASGDLQLALGGIPGIAVTPGSGGTASYTIAGLDGGQNRVTVNGVDAGPVAPRDAGLLRVATSGYDPTEAMSGVRSELMIFGANYGHVRRLRLTFDAPALRSTGPIATTLGQRSAAPILSGRIAGPVGRFLRFHTTSFQVSRQASSLATLGSIDDGALDALGLSPDSVRRLVGAVDQLGIGTIASMHRAIDRVTTTGSLSSRLDFTTNSLGHVGSLPDGRASGQAGGRDGGRVFYLIVGGNGAESRGTGAGALTMPAYASTSRSYALGVQLFNSIYPREHIINETRVSARSERSRFEPDSPLPAAAVLAIADAPRGVLASMEAAGSGGATNTTGYWSLQARNDTRWSSVGGRHEWKLAVEAQVDGASSERGPSRGRFEFRSVEDFAASRAAAFSRSITASATDVRGVHVAAAAGDEYAPARALAVQYGVRLEGHGVNAETARNPTVDSLFGVRTGGLPMRLSFAPMAGFTWRYRKQPNGIPSNHHQIAGGIRDYRGTLLTRSAQAILGETGLADGLRELRCIDAATPRPEWDRYADFAAIPSSCADGNGGASFAQSALPVSVYSPNFALGHSVRAELRWKTRMTAGAYLTVRGLTALNTRQPSVVDLNFDAVPRFTLAEEARRPVFATPANIALGSGLTSTVESRRHPQFSHVSELRSDLRSRSSSLTGTLELYPAMSRLGSGTKTPLAISYTIFDTQGQATGFKGTTAGDPRVAGWEPATSSRHVFQLTSAIHIPDWFRLTTGLTVRSGLHYTPIVQGDVNADGLANDRAFVFDSRATTDETGAGIAALLNDAPSRAGRCLREQLGRIAAAQSCTGPWTTTLNASVTVDPARVRLQNRGTLQLRVTNILAGVDQIVHGGERMSGWGQPAYPDPVLLQVRGFDPMAGRYRYAVNPSFGDTRVYRNVVQSPFRIALEIALDVGPNRERQSLKRNLAPDALDASTRPDSAAIADRLRRAFGARNAFEQVLRKADDFKLEPAQIDSLEALGRRHIAFRDSTYDALAGYLAARWRTPERQDVLSRWRESIRAVARFEWHTGMLARELLRGPQAEEVFSRNGPLGWRPIVFDERELERTLRLWQEQVY